MLASIPSPSFNVFDVGPLTIHIYGILMGIAVGTAYVVLARRYEKLGGDRRVAESAGFWCIVIGFIGARLAYVLPRLDNYSDDWLGVFRMWEGGIALFGGLTFGAAAAVFVVRRRRGNFWVFADAAAVALPGGQAIGRWGNYFNQELFGTPTTLPWGLAIDPENRPRQVPRRRDLPPHLPVRDAVEHRHHRAPAVAGAAPQVAPGHPLRPLRGPVLGGPLPAGAHPHRLPVPLPGAEPQWVVLAPGGPGGLRPALVDPAPPEAPAAGAPLAGDAGAAVGDGEARDEEGGDGVMEVCGGGGSASSPPGSRPAAGVSHGSGPPTPCRQAPEFGVAVAAARDEQQRHRRGDGGDPHHAPTLPGTLLPRLEPERSPKGELATASRSTSLWPGRPPTPWAAPRP